jgi:hypothetical protein
VAIITAYCADAQGLKLGPGNPGTPAIQTPGEVIVFDRGYATFDEKDFPLWRTWLVGAPTIEVLDEGEVIATDAEFVCATCGKAFESKAKLNGHRMSHRPK